MKRFLFLVVTLFFVLCLPQQAEAAEKPKTYTAYDFGQISEFKKELEKDYSVFKMEINAKEGAKRAPLYVKGKKDPINLAETLELGSSKNDSENDPIYRYHFWVKPNNLASNGIHWSTEYFIGTTDPVGDGSHASTYKPKGAKIERLSAREEKGSGSCTNNKMCDRIIG